MDPNNERRDSNDMRCDSCARYQVQPLWGHIHCSAHRPCAGSSEWEPFWCLDCNIQRDKLDLCTEQGVKESLDSLQKLLSRTRTWKLNKTSARDWCYQRSLETFLSGFVTPSGSPVDDRNDVQRPGDEVVRDGSVIGHTPCSSVRYRVSESVRSGSDIAIVRDSVRSALDERTRNIIDHNIDSVSDMLRQADITSHPPDNTVPKFQLVQNTSGENAGDFAKPHVPYAKEPQQMPFIPNTSDPVASRPDLFAGHAPFFPNGIHPNVNALAPTHHALGTDKLFLKGQFYIDPNDNCPWFIFDPNIHRKISANRVVMSHDNSFTSYDVIFHPLNNSYFRTRPQSSRRSIPFMGGPDAHAIMLGAFGARPSEDMSPANNVRSMEMTIPPTSGLSETLDLLKRHENAVLDGLINKKDKDILTAFPGEAFDPSTIVKFTQGWSMCSDYFEWAFDQPLSVDSFYNSINLPKCLWNPIPETLKIKEQDTRRVLVCHISSVHLVESFGIRASAAAHTEYKETFSSESRAVTRTMLPVFKHLSLPWQKAKMELRMAVLSGFEQNFESICLLKTSLWEPGLFPRAAIEHLAHKRINNIPQMLGLLRQYPQDVGNARQPPRANGTRRFQKRRQVARRSAPYNIPQQNFRDKPPQSGQRRNDTKKQSGPSARQYNRTKNSQQTNKFKHNKPTTTSKTNKKQGR